jgi:hypothetical protein
VRRPTPDRAQGRVEAQVAPYPGRVTSARIPRERNGVADEFAKDGARASKALSADRRRWVPRQVGLGPERHEQIGRTRAAPKPLPTGDSRLRGGALMEPSGRNQWQPVANGRAPKMPRTSQNRCHGKEGVDGSSPSEGFSFLPA